MRLHLGLEFDQELPPRVRDELDQIIATLQVWQAQVAPNDASVVVAAAHSDLTDERVALNTSTVRWDFSSPGKAQLHAIGAAGPAMALMLAESFRAEDPTGGVALFPAPTSTSTTPATDHVVMSDGGDPPWPLTDGNGNFLYIEYDA